MSLAQSPPSRGSMNDCGLVARGRAGHGKDCRLTERQRALVEVIRAYLIKHGVAPTYREMGDELGITRASAFEMVRSIIYKGALTNTSRGSSARGLRLSPELHQHDRMVRYEGSAFLVDLAEEETGPLAVLEKMPVNIDEDGRHHLLHAFVVFLLPETRYPHDFVHFYERIETDFESLRFEMRFAEADRAEDGRVRMIYAADLKGGEG